jgi:hypothetical protein
MKRLDFLKRFGIGLAAIIVSKPIIEALSAPNTICCNSVMHGRLTYKKLEELVREIMFEEQDKGNIVLMFYNEHHYKEFDKAMKETAKNYLI